MPCGRTNHRSGQSRPASSPGCRSEKKAFRQWLLALYVDSCSSYHQVIQVLLESIVVEALESLSVVELVAERVVGGAMLAEDVEPELIRPPVTVLDYHGVSEYALVLLDHASSSRLTLVPPPPVLATRTGHLEGSSPRLPIVAYVLMK